MKNKKRQNKLGLFIRSAREDRDMSRHNLSSAMKKENRITASTIGQIERGEIRQPPMKRLEEFARIFKVSADMLVKLVVAVAIAWFSHGAASAVTCGVACQQLSADELVVVNIQPFSNGIYFDKEDNKRFEKECEKLYQKLTGDDTFKIYTFHSDEGYANHFEVLEEVGYINNAKAGNGAPCCKIKKNVNEKVYKTFWKRTGEEWFGFSVEEKHRKVKFEKYNPEKTCRCPLIENNWNKDNCIWWLESHGVTPPKVYNTFCNNNCIGCAKASNMRYWNIIREKFPKIWKRMARLEKKVDHKMHKISRNKKTEYIFLPDVPRDAGRKIKLAKAVKPDNA